MLNNQEIEDIHNRHWKKGYGSISANEALFLQTGITNYKPKQFIEIGTASGLSTGFIALFMDENAGVNLTTLDLDTTFWVDRTKATGFLTEKIYQHDRVDIDFIRGEISPYINGHFPREYFDMAFIDANHQHPWPTLDMICLLPMMKPGSLIYHHDLALYKNQTPIFGIGPKYLFDQVPDEMKKVTSEPRGNIFFIRSPEDYTSMQQSLIDSLYLPWTIRNTIEESVIRSIAKIATDSWSLELSDTIISTANKFNLA